MDSFSWISAQSLHAVVWVGVIYIGLPDLVHGRRSCSCFWRRPSSKCWWIYQTNLRFTDEMEPLCSERNEKSQWMCCDCLQGNNVISHLRSYIRRLWIRYHSYPIAGVLTLFFGLQAIFEMTKSKRSTDRTAALISVTDPGCFLCCWSPA